MSSRKRRCTRREFGKMVTIGAGVFSLPPDFAGMQERQTGLDENFFVRSGELTLRALQAPGNRSLSFANFGGTRDEWRDACKAKLAELIGFEAPSPGTACSFRGCPFSG